MSRVWSWTLEIPLNHGFEFHEHTGLDVELPLEVGAHFPFHLVDLPKGKHALIDNAPGPIGVGVITYDLESHCKRGGEEEGAGRGAGWDSGTVEQAVDVSSAHLCGVLMTVVWVLEVEWETGLERERKADVLDAEDMWWR